MKKRLSLLLASCLFLLSFTACGKAKTVSKTRENIQTVMMVYMVGSDLESKSGAASDDLHEMETSGIDLNTSELLVYTGGTSKWRNSLVDSEKNYLLRLGNDGFKIEESFESTSMGQAETLSSFLNYTYEHYSAQRFALVLWDHGNGPVIGYGKDTAHEKDTLTLLEMKEALQSSPFQKKNKLEWVGFDACLMASAELAAVWSDHAKYLVASQEIEPAGGWDYASLSDVDTADTPDLLNTVADNYLKACLDYFESRGYEGREATLACLDLSAAPEMISAVESLFAGCDADVEKKYDTLTALRANTRAFGRASTGSEYDLVDLADMATQLNSIYPDESAKILSAIEKMVIHNATNTPLSCGISLYYPFYNKHYYQESWSEEYGKLGIFPNYLSYLKKYEKTWLVESDAVFSYATSVTPSMISANKYSYQLTEEQAKHYASCRYYILVKEGQNVYQPVFISQSVTLDGDRLIADFDGKILYVKNKYNEYFIPDTYMLDKVGDYVRYSLRVATSTQYEGYPFVYSSTKLRNDSIDSNNKYGNEKFDFSRLENFESETGYCRYVLAVNPTTSNVSVTSLVEVDDNTTLNDLTGGKLKDFDLSGWTTVVFPGQHHYLLRRSENGVVLPVGQWIPNGVLSHNETVASDEIEFVYDYLFNDNYAMVFEITDTQGNSYCSEPIDLETKTVEGESYHYEESELEWNDGDSLTVFKDDDLSVEMLKFPSADNKIVFRTQNKSEKDIEFIISDLVLNDTISTDDSLICYIPKGKQEIDDITIDEALLFELDPIHINSIEFSLEAKDIDTRNVVTEKRYSHIKLGNKTAFTLDPTIDPLSIFDQDHSLPYPFLGMRSENKVLYDQDDIKVTLLRFGSEREGYSGEACLRIENHSKKTVNVFSDGCLFDDRMIEHHMQVTAYAGTTVYEKLSFSDRDIEEAGITSASTFTLQLRFSNSTWNGWMGYGSYTFIPVPLDQSGTKTDTFKEGSQILFQQNGIRISLLSKSDEHGSSKLAVVNDSDQDIQLDVLVEKDGQELYSAFSNICYLSGERVKAHSKGICELSRYDSDNTDPVTVRFLVNDLTGENTLLTAEKKVVVP